MVQREETSSFGSSCKVEKLNFQFEGYLGSSTSLFWNTQLISNRQPTQQRGPTGVYLSQERIVTFPYEWQEFRSEILLDLQEGRKVQMWVLREAEIPETLEDELKHHCIEWVLVPSRYEEFQRFFQKAWQSPVKSWSLALLPSVDSRDAWLSPELAVDCMETLGRENFSARRVLVIEESLKALSLEVQAVFLEPNYETLKSYWRTRSFKKYLLKGQKLLALRPNLFLLSTLYLSLRILMRPSLVVLKPYWMLAYQYKTRVYPFFAKALGIKDEA